MMSPPAPGDAATMSRIGRTGYPPDFSCAIAAPQYASTAPMSHQPNALIMPFIDTPPTGTTGSYGRAYAGLDSDEHPPETSVVDHTRMAQAGGLRSAWEEAKR